MANQARYGHGTSAEPSKDSSLESQSELYSNLSLHSTLCMSIAGVEIDGPFELGRGLTQRLQERYSDELAKLKVVHGNMHLHQGISHLPCLTTSSLTRLFLSHACEYYQDREISIILKAQLDLWPTGSQLAKCGVTTGNQRCRFCRRQNETVSHLLTIVKNDTAGEAAHPEPLASLATQRHNRIVQSITTQLASSKLYTFIAEEKRILVNDLQMSRAQPTQLNPQPGPEEFVSASDQGELGRRLIQPPSSVRFSKPDIVLVCEARGLGERPTCLLVDVICAGDEHVLLEHEIGYQTLIDNLHLFNGRGMSHHTPLDSERAEAEPHRSRGPRIPILIERTLKTQGGTSNINKTATPDTISISYSPTASKLVKYSAYVQYVTKELGMRCEIVPLTFGVRGFVPQATFNHVLRLTQPKDAAKMQPHLAKKVLVPIMHIIFSTIIKTYGAWQSSNPSFAPFPPQ